MVKAENAEDAVQKAEEAVERDEILLDTDDFDERETVLLECWKEGEIPDGEDVSSYWQLNNNDDV